MNSKRLWTILKYIRAEEIFLVDECHTAVAVDEEGKGLLNKNQSLDLVALDSSKLLKFSAHESNVEFCIRSVEDCLKGNNELIANDSDGND